MDSKGSILMQRFEIGKLLGHGNFAKVYHGRNLETGVSVAIKVIDKKKVLKSGMMNQITREISVMRLVKHPNVVQLYEVLASKTKIYFILEYAKGGEVFHKVAKGEVNEDAARKYFRQLISAVDFCHTRGVYHRDLKPENLLLDDEGNLKVSDFGLSALAEAKARDCLLHTSCVTPAYVAPEVIDQKGYNGAKADIWSCGVVLFVFLARFLPFHDSNLMEMYRKITRAEFKFPNAFPNEAKSLVSKILDPNPVTRFSTVEIMENPWFKKGLVEETGFLSLENPFEETKDFEKCGSLNAFDIISFSRGLNLSGFFNENADDENETRFITNQTVTNILLKLEEIAKRLKLNVMKNNGVWLKLEGLKESKSDGVAIGLEIFEIMPNVHLIEVNRFVGDIHEFREIVNDHIRPAMSDVIGNP